MATSILHGRLGVSLTALLGIRCQVGAEYPWALSIVDDAEVFQDRPPGVSAQRREHRADDVQQLAGALLVELDRLADGALILSLG